MAISTLVVALTARTTDFERSLKRVETTLGRSARQVQSLGATMTTAMSLPMSAAGGAAVKMATSFDSSMEKIVGLVGLSQQQVGSFRGSVLALAGQTAQAPQALADALYFITSAGLKGKYALDALKASAQASAAGLGNMNTIADALTSAMNAYGPANLSAAQATSVLVAAVREGKAEASAIAPVLGRVIPIASQLGISFDQVGAAIAAMTRVGFSADEASTALRATMTTLLKPSAQAQTAFAQMGLSAASLREELKGKGLLAVLGTLKTAMQGNDDAMSQVFPNGRALAGVLSLVGANAKSTQEVFASLAKTTTNDLATAFNSAAGTAAFKFQQALSQLQVVLIRLGEDILPVLVPVVQRLAAAVDLAATRYEHLSAGGKNLVLVTAAAAAALGPLLLALAGLYTAGSTAVGVLRLFLGLTGLANLFSAAQVAVAGLGSALLELAGYFRAFGAAETLAGVVLPALGGSVLLAGALAAAAAYLWISKWDELKTDMGYIVDFLREKYDALNQATFGLIGGVQRLADAFNPLMAIRGLVGGALGSAATAAAAGAASLKTGVLSELGQLESGVGSMASRLVTKMQGLASGIVGNVKGLSFGVPSPAPAPATAAGAGGAGPAAAEVQQQISLWRSLGDTMKEQGSVTSITLNAFKQNAIAAAQSFKTQVHGMVSATEQSMGAMAAAFLQGKTNIGQFVRQMVVAIGELIAKILILQALTAAGMGGPFASGLVGGLSFGGGHAAGGRVSRGSWYMVGEKGPEPFVPDTSGTIIPHGAVNGGAGGPTLILNQTISLSGVDYGSEDAAKRLANTLKDHTRAGTQELVSLALQLKQTADAKAGRAV